MIGCVWVLTFLWLGIIIGVPFSRVIMQHAISGTRSLAQNVHEGCLPMPPGRLMISVGET